MTDDGHMNAAAGAYAGLDRFEARKKIVEDLKAPRSAGENSGAHAAIGICERSKTIVEPRVSTQWFCKMKPLAEPAIAAVEKRGKKYHIVPGQPAAGIFQLDEEYPRLDAFAAALVGTPHSGVVLRGLRAHHCGGRERRRSAEVRIEESDARSGRAGYLV